MTPPIPHWMHSARIPGYTNIYEVLPNEARVYGTESLFGDWDGRVLLLAQDFAPIQYVLKQMAEGETDPFRHNPLMQTNKRLIQHTAHIRESDSPSSCGILYGSALAGLCKDDASVRGVLPSRGLAIEYGARVLSYVVENMPNLKVILGLGSVPNAMISELMEPACDWKSARDACRAVHTDDGRTLVFASHPVSSTKREVVMERWNLLAGALCRSEAA